MQHHSIEETTDYIQLRDTDMKLLAFFSPVRVKKIIKEYNLENYVSMINKIIETGETGKIYKICYYSVTPTNYE